MVLNKLQSYKQKNHFSQGSNRLKVRGWTNLWLWRDLNCRLGWTNKTEHCVTRQGRQRLDEGNDEQVETIGGQGWPTGDAWGRASDLKQGVSFQNKTGNDKTKPRDRTNLTTVWQIISVLTRCCFLPVLWCCVIKLNTAHTVPTLPLQLTSTTEGVGSGYAVC